MLLASLYAINSSRHQKVTDDLDAVKSHLTKIDEKQEKAEAEAKKDKEAINERIKALEDRLVLITNNPPRQLNHDALEDAVKRHVDTTSDSSWRANLAKEIFEHEHG